MAEIKTKVINVSQIFDGAFVLLTEDISSIVLEHRLHTEEPLECYKTFIIRTKGIFRGCIQIDIEEKLLKNIVNNISKGAKLQETEIILYTMEYLNIVCGRALSEINNQIGKSSRLTVPQYIQNVTNEPPLLNERSEEREEIYFDSEFGKMNILVTYHFDSER